MGDRPNACRVPRIRTRDASWPKGEGGGQGNGGRTVRRRFEEGSKVRGRFWNGAKVRERGWMRARIRLSYPRGKSLPGRRSLFPGERGVVWSEKLDRDPFLRCCSFARMLHVLLPAPRLRLAYSRHLKANGLRISEEKPETLPIVRSSMRALEFRTGSGTEYPKTWPEDMTRKTWPERHGPKT
jgi:hypothetical protein